MWPMLCASQHCIPQQFKPRLLQFPSSYVQMCLEMQWSMVQLLGSLQCHEGPPETPLGSCTPYNVSLL